jgi:2-hydroxy-6-oxonona-2,4-dienedioate hydrolase
MSLSRSLWSELRGTSFSQGWLDVDGIKTRYLRSGDDSKPPLLFLHGAGGHAEAYLRNLKAHGEHFNTWSVDMIGHGWTDKPDYAYTIPRYVEHLLKLMDQQGWAKVRISGESLGGWVASYLAWKHPQRIERMVLNTAGGFHATQETMDRIKTISMRAATDPTWEFIKARVEWLMLDPKDATPELIACRQEIYSQPGYAKAMTHAMILQEMEERKRDMLSDDDFRSIKTPTLVLWTSHDPSAPVEVGKRVAGIIPNARFVVMDNCGHWPQWEDTATFNRIHINFMLDRPLETPL